MMPAAISFRFRLSGLALRWLVALSGGEASYARFVNLVSVNPLGHALLLVVLIGLTWAFLQHMCSGIRHLLLDTGAGYELKRNKQGALSTVVISSTLTIILWAAIFMRGF